MNKFWIGSVLLLIGASASANATDDKKMNMKMMDANGDGMISKDEFLKFHEMLFDRMKKNKAGMVDMKDMDMMHQNMQMMHQGQGHHKDDTSTSDKKVK
jgi:hypothetical protein